MVITDDNELPRKPVRTNKRCEKMLDKAIKFIEQDSPTQAAIMRSQFFNVMRRFLLGKFPYYVYYKELANYTKIVGIWHTSRGTEFS